MEQSEREQLSSYLTIPSALKASSTEYTDRPALIGYGGQGETYTYSQMQALIEALSTHISSIATTAELVGILSENCPEWAITYLSILATGKTVLPIDSNLTATEIKNIINHSGVKLIFCSGKFESQLAGFPDLSCFSFDENSAIYWKSKINSADKSVADVITDKQNVAALIYTSGTTGKAKAVQLTHRNLLSNIEAVSKIFQFGVNDIFLSVLPLHHTFESTCGMLTPLFSGSSIVYARSLKSNEILEDIKNNNVTIMCGVPLLYEKIYNSFQRRFKSVSFTKKIILNLFMNLTKAGWKIGKSPGKKLFRSLREKSGLNSIRLFVSGGAAIPPEISRFYNYIGFSLLQGYGMTECSPVISANHPNDIRFETVGRPLDNLDVQIKNKNQDGIGEIIVRGESITPGYKDESKLTNDLIQDGWLHTGDLGMISNNHLIITGRSKNLIVSSAGKNIYPEEIEQLLSQSDLILEALVIGRPSKNKQGETVCSLIVPDTEFIQREELVSSMSKDDQGMYQLINKEVQAINKKIAPYKRISQFEIRFEEFEKTSTKKIKRFLYN